MTAVLAGVAISACWIATLTGALAWTRHQRTNAPQNHYPSITRTR